MKLNHQGHVVSPYQSHCFLLTDPLTPPTGTRPCELIYITPYGDLRCVLKLENYESYHVHKNHQGLKFIDNDPSKQNTVIFESTVF